MPGRGIFARPYWVGLPIGGEITRARGWIVIEPLEHRRLLSAAGAAVAPALSHHVSTDGVMPALVGGTIAGSLWNDRNADGAWDYPDTPLVGWRVYLDLDHNGAFDGDDLSVATDRGGHYQFRGLPAGTYTVRYVNQPGFHPAPNQPASAQVTISSEVAKRSESNEETAQVSFGLTTANGQISGTVSEVLPDGSETGARHWGVYLDTNNNGRIDPGEPWTTTDAHGHFAFTDLPFGVYHVRVDPLHLGWSSTSVSGQSYTIFSDGQKASAPVTFAYQEDPPIASYSPAQLVDYVLVGGSSSDAATRAVSRGTFGAGWWGFVARNVIPDIVWGTRRILLFNPFGVGEEPSFPADQFLEAQNAGLTWLTGDFVNAWAPITRSGVEVIGYIGSPESDPSFQALASDPAAWNARFNASIAPLVQAGMSIGFDLGQVMTQGDLFSQAIDRLRAQGVKVYLENRPPEFAPYNLTFPVISVSPGWDTTNPYLDPRQGWAAKNSEVLPGVVQLIQYPPPGTSWTDRQWLLGTIRAILRDGDSAGIPISVLRSAGVSLSEILTPLRTPTPAPVRPVHPPPPSPPPRLFHNLIDRPVADI